MTFRLTKVQPPLALPLGLVTWPGASIFDARIAAFRTRMKDESLDVAIIYGDREHVGNIAYLCGYDPRFEEALLIVFPAGAPRLLVGNEGMAYAGVCQGMVERVLCQSFSLIDQPRDTSPPLTELLKHTGLKPGQTAGMIGWKYFGVAESSRPETTLEVPSFMADAARAVLGHEHVRNATALLMHPADGLRIRLEAEQIVAFEAIAQKASVGVLQALKAITPGYSEFEIAEHLGYDGRPLNYHPIVASGERTALGLASPSHRVIAEGDPLFVTMGGWGANTVRAGYVVAEGAALDRVDAGYVEDVVTPYMNMIAAWYETVGVGARAGDTVAAVEAARAGRIERIALNPGHHIHIDEWVSSPFRDGSDIELRSGMMLQMDIIPVVENGGFGINAEDGVVLADAELRSALKSGWPDVWQRFCSRRDYMRDHVGISLDESVLPLSDIQGWVTPLLGDLSLAMSRVA